MSFGLIEHGHGRIPPTADNIMSLKLSGNGRISPDVGTTVFLLTGDGQVSQDTPSTDGVFYPANTPTDCEPFGNSTAVITKHQMKVTWIGHEPHESEMAASHEEDCSKSVTPGGAQTHLTHSPYDYMQKEHVLLEPETGQTMAGPSQSVPRPGKRPILNEMTLQSKSR